MNDNDKTVRKESVPPMSSGTHEQGGPLLETGMMQPPQTPGTLGMIGKYQVIRILGEGGMGQVLLAREPVTDSLVAVKIIKPEYLKKDWAVHRFLTEARHMFKMSHPSMIRVLEVSDRPEGPYFVMPYMAGGSLAQKIKPGEALPSDMILKVARQVAEALQYAHTRGIIHRDLKPSNILLDNEGGAYLCDFGLLRTVFNDSVVDVTKPQVEGTVPYMSPAVAEGKAEDTRCDIYGFGCLLYEMLTGQPPYQGPTVDAILKQIQAGPPQPILQLNPNASARLAAIAEHAMGRELRDRYAAMSDVIRDLDRAAQGKEPLGPRGRANGGHLGQNVLAVIGTVALVGLAAHILSNLPSRKPSVPAPAKAAPVPANAKNDLKRGLVLHFSFDKEESDGIVTDQSGLGNNGRVFGAKWTAQGRCGGTYRFAPPRQYIRVSNNDSLNPSNLTLSAWIKTSRSDDTWRRVFDKSWTNGYALSIGGGHTPGNTFKGRAAAEVGGKVPGVNGFACSDRAVTDGEWHHVAVTHSNGEECLYVDGVRQQRGARTRGGVPPNSFDLTIGMNLVDPNPEYDEVDASFDGLIDEPMIWNRALSPEEVKTLFDSQLAGGEMSSSQEQWTNSLGMRFVPIPGTKVLFSIWETRVCDFEAFVGATKRDMGAEMYISKHGSGPNPSKGYNWSNPYFSQTPLHPVVGVSWHDARAFCAWLTEKERRERKITSARAYRLPTDAEWSRAVGDTRYPWGDSWPPVGNYAGEEAHDVDWPENWGVIAGYRDGFPRTAPVGTFPGNWCGLFDMGGNVWEWCEDVSRNGKTSNDGGSQGKHRVMRGASWFNFKREGEIPSVFYHERPPDMRDSRVGFRCVLAGAVGDFVPQVQSGAASAAANSPTATPRDQFTWTTNDGVINITKYTGPGGAVAIPDTINGLPVRSIGDSAFSKCASLVSITIPDSVIIISNAAFSRCTNLTSVTIGANVTSVGDWAFDYCTKLTSITIPNSVTTIGVAEFYGCTSLTSIIVGAGNPCYSSVDGVLFDKRQNKLIEYLAGKAGSTYTIPNSVTCIGPWAFGSCHRLTNVTIPNSVTDIERQAFSDCTNLANVRLPSGLTRIADMSFRGCTKFTSVTIPGGVTSIEYGAFNGCAGLTNITIPNSVTTIGDSAFVNCPRLATIRIPASVTSLDVNTRWRANILKGSSALTSIEVDAANPAFSSSADGVLFNKDKTSLLIYPGGKAGSYEVPGSVTNIGFAAFSFCNGLTSITIPNSVTTIEESAFYKCYGLTKIYFEGDAPKLGQDAFTYIDKATIYHLPEAKGWDKEFGGLPTAP